MSRRFWLGGAAALLVTGMGCDLPGWPPPQPEGVFPEGSHLMLSPWVVSFGGGYPYVLTTQAEAHGDPSGGFNGTYYWIFWESQASYNADDGKDDPDCVFIEQMEAVPHLKGSDPDYDYASCQYCEDFWEVTLTWWEEHEGCSQELIDFWYLNPQTGEYIYEFTQNMGYRHAETDGWPGEFANFSSGLSEAGWEGTVYDELYSGSEGEFFPMYLTMPYGSRSGDPDLDVRQLRTVSRDDLRPLLGR